MNLTRFRTRILIPVALIAACLLVLSVLTATSLIAQQKTVAKLQRENLGSRRVAIELDECLTDLLILLRDRVDDTSKLHERSKLQLVEIRNYADQDTEKLLADRLEKGFANYLKLSTAVPPKGSPGHDEGIREAALLLEVDVLRPCREFKQFNSDRIESTTQQHERELTELAWGMAGIGFLGATAGIVLGFGISGAVNRNIRSLQVRIRDAAGLLGPESADVVVTVDGKSSRLHTDIELLTDRIATVVKELQQRKREIRWAERLAAVGQLAAGVAHEIRNPLTSIKLLVQSGLEVGHELAPADLRIIEAEVRRMEKSLGTFLEFARPPKMERRPMEIRKLLQDTLELLRPRSEKQRVQLVLSADTEVDLVADREQLNQVFVNLMLNALDAMPETGTLSVRMRRVRQRVEIEVADTGQGISAAMLPRLFEPFASSKDSGLGLGLVISKRIIEEHGGSLAAANRTDGGASFFVNIPILVTGDAHA